jgi:hypothetical protein
MSGSLDWLKTSAAAVRNWADDYRQWTAFVDELEEAGEDGQRLLEQLRLCNGDIRKLMTSASSQDAALLYRLMRTLGIEASEIEAGILLDLERVCGGCEHKAACSADLDRGDAAAWTGYCDNKVNLEAILTKGTL